MLKDYCSEKIYMDGYLPMQKRGIRISRLESSLRQMVTLRSTTSKLGVNYGISTPRDLDLSGDGAAWLFSSSKTTKSKLKGLPAAPFMIPAILDALNLSECHSITHVVSGEADCFCAEAARNGEFIILTGDSDPLVYDLGPYSSVVFFNQIDLKPHSQELNADAPSCGVIEARLYKPREIALRLGQKNLLRIAFEITRDPSILFSKALQRSAKPSDQQAYLESFEKEYNESSPVEMSLTNNVTEWLDPRVSELVLQLVSKSPDPIQMYLPFLIDDPSRASAWALGMSNRVLAYSCINHMLSEPDQYRKIFEFGRKGYRIVPQDINMLSLHACTLQAENLTAQLDYVQDIILREPSSGIWRMLGVLSVYKWYIESDKNAPSSKAISGLTENTPSETSTWEEIHLFAQLEAYLYSLRILKQILGYTRIFADGKLPAPLLELETRLRSLPNIDKLLLSRPELPRQNRSQPPSESVVDTLLTPLDTETVQRAKKVVGQLEKENACDTAELLKIDEARRPAKRGRKRKKSSKNEPQPPSRQLLAPNNKYSILANS